MSYQHRFHARYVYMLCLAASAGGFMFGYSEGVIAATLESIQHTFGLNSVQTGWAVSSVIFGGVIGALTAGKMANKTGRKPVMLLSAILFVITSYFSAVADSFTLFTGSRLICGIAVGLAATVAPMYISEISPAKMRGKATGTYDLSMVVGVLAVFTVNYLIARGMPQAWMVETGWRIMMAVQLVPSLAMLVLIVFLPESPHWCIRHNRSEQAIKVLSRIYPELNQEEARQLFQLPSSPARSSNTGSKGALADNPALRYILVVGVAIAVLQQFTGINVINYYTPMMLEGTTSDKDIIFFETIFVALLNGIGAFIGMHLFDHYGRLPIMKIGSVGAIIGLLIASWGLYSNDVGYIAISGILIFTLFFGMGWGAGAWVMISEIFPDRIREFSMGLAVGLMWISNFLITLVFPIVNDNAWLQEQFHGAFSMWIFVAFNVVCYWFLSRYVPETRGVALEDIEKVAEAKMLKNSLSVQTEKG